MSEAPAGAPGGRGAGARLPALLWALLHVPLFLALFAAPMATAVAAAPARYRLALWPTFVPQANVLALIAFVLALPVAPLPRAYRWAVGAAAGLVTAVVTLDAVVFRSVGFHLNGFFFKVLAQPDALREVGVPPWEAALFLAATAALVAGDALAGAWFVRRFATRRPAWPLLAALVLLSGAERVYGGLLTYFGGPAILSASATLPLQLPVRMEGTARKLFGDRGPDPLAASGASRTLPPLLRPEDVHLARTPDVIFVVAESLPASHLDERTMPNLWRRATAGARFTHHHSSASSTSYALFSLMYGLQAQKLEATVGAGRQPVLFPALTRHGYQVKVTAASCVDWMGLKDTVFAGVSDLETWCEDLEPARRDDAMLRSARAFLASAEPRRPLFLFLFFYSTHFDYFYGPEDRVFSPDWDGQGGFNATSVSGPLIEARARNAAHAVDRLLEGFLREVEARRGAPPLLVFTGDHGEEFRQKGHLGHGSDVTEEQIHVPLVLAGPGVPAGTFEAVTSHVDVVPTLLSLLGDANPPERWSDGASAFRAPEDRFVLATVGWEPRYAAVGRDLKVTMYAGLGTARVTDPEDRPLADGELRLARHAGQIVRALRGDAAAQAEAASASSR